MEKDSEDTLLRGVACNVLFGGVTFGQRPKWKEGMSHMFMGEESFMQMRCKCEVLLASENKQGLIAAYINLSWGILLSTLHIFSLN